MGSSYTPNPVGSGFQTETNLNAELEQIRLDLVDKVDREGVGPNAMAADLDVGTNQLLNVEEGILGTDGANLNQVNNIVTSVATSIFNTLFGGGGGGTTGDPITFNYGTATGSQGTMTRTVFDLFTLFGVSEMLGLTVFIDGVFQDPASYTVSDVTTVTFSESLETDTKITFVYGDVSPTPIFSNANATLNETTATATLGQTVFTAPTYVIGQGQLMVHIDGIMQSLGFGDYTETSTTSITLDEAMAGNERIVIRNITGI